LGTHGVFFLVFTVALSFAPRVLADTAQNDTQQYLRMFDYLFQFVKNNYVDDVPAEKLYEGAAKGLFESLGDPHSVYLSREKCRISQIQRQVHTGNRPVYL
jgi:C-terminal processing protease CtpA/Prc